MHIYIVGQGIAGSLLAWHLEQQGHVVTLVDQGHIGAASTVAAGIINPVTGKRYVKSWRYDDFFEIAKATYQQLEDSLDLKIWKEKPILRILNSIEESNDWSLRCGEYQDLITEASDAGDWTHFLKPAPAFGFIKQGARVDFQALLDGIQAFFKEKGLFETKKLSFEEISPLASNCDALVFCGGAVDLYNPFFKGIQWQLAKGEALLIELPEADLDFDGLPMLKKGIMLTQIKDRLFWAGSNYDWSFEDAQPTEFIKKSIIENLDATLQVSYKVIAHRAAIRPTVKDRRPLLGKSLEHDNVFMFNGLGTKGALLAPALAVQLSNHIIEGSPLDMDVDVKRFWGKH